MKESKAIVDYDDILKEILDKNQKLKLKPSLLLHSCCAPCSSYVVEYLKPFFNITLLFYNPNIMPKEEYVKRLVELRRLSEIMDISLIEGEYDNLDFLNEVIGLESEKEGGIRCKKCINMRLKRSVRYAKAGDFDYFATTLTVSPHKNPQIINTIGIDLSKKYNILYLPSNFKKNNGYKRSIEISKELGLYRQNYCGCKF